LPAGWFKLTQPLTIPSHVTLCGEGIATVLLWDGAGPAIVSAGTTDVVVRRLCVRGGPGIAFKNVRGGLIESVTAEGAHGAGITVAHGDDILITQCTARDCETGYEFVEVANLDLAESRSRNSRQDGLKITRPKGRVTIDSSIFSASQQCGILAQSSESNQLLITSSVVEKSGANGIRLQDCVGATVQGSIVHGSGAAGVLLAGNTRNSMVIENRISNQRIRQTPGISVGGLSVEEAGAANQNEVRHNVLCTFGHSGSVIAVKGQQSIAEGNILTPQAKASRSEKQDQEVE
jgi:parallel beta-helix repeat protein